MTEAEELREDSVLAKLGRDVSGLGLGENFDLSTTESARPPNGVDPDEVETVGRPKLTTTDLDLPVATAVEHEPVPVPASAPASESPPAALTPTVASEPPPAALPPTVASEPATAPPPAPEHAVASEPPQPITPSEIAAQAEPKDLLRRGARAFGFTPGPVKVAPHTRPATPNVPLSTAPDSLPPPSEQQSATTGPSPACPQCEAPMAWVEAHLRFYCKSCRMYF